MTYGFNECLTYLPDHVAQAIREQPQAHTGVVEFDKPNDIVVMGIWWNKTKEGIEFWQRYIK